MTIIITNTKIMIITTDKVGGHELFLCPVTRYEVIIKDTLKVTIILYQLKPFFQNIYFLLFHFEVMIPS